MESKEPLPETVRWLLDFANLGCIPGEPNPQRFKSYHTDTFQEYITNEHIPKLKRPPIEMLPPEKKEKDTFYKLSPDEKRERLEGEQIHHSLPLHEIIRIFRELGSTNHILYDGYEISISKTGEAVFHGRNIELFPLIVDFCSKKGILLKINCKHVFSHKKCNYSMAMTYWHIAQSVFNRVMLENSGEGVHPFVKMAFDYAKENKPAHKLSQWVSECVRDFWDNQRVLHSHLRQCKYCGTFWIPGKEKGKTRKIFCEEICERKFTAPSRANNRKRVRDLRASNKESQQPEDAQHIEEWLKDKENYTPKEAKERANKLVYEQGETFKNYKRKAIPKYGIPH